MTPTDLHLVVMAGGSGTRFWPKSTSVKPKQFLSFYTSTDSLLKQTVDRFSALQAKAWVVTTQSLSKLTGETVGANVQILAEPEGRNTAPCIFWAAKEIEKLNPKAVMAVMPADHSIRKVDAFLKTLSHAIDHARLGKDLVTLGVNPTRAETGYGYLELGSDLGGGCFQVKKFIEKPNAIRAKSFFESGNTLWNGGMFVWRVDTLLTHFDQYLPEYTKAWNKYSGEVAKLYPELEATSIDFGLMEKAKNVVTFKLDCAWDDLGSWTSIEEFLPKSYVRDGNLLCDGELCVEDSSFNIIDVPGKKVALLGAKNLIIVEAGGVLLVADKSRAQDIKKLVEKAKKSWPGKS